MSATLIPPGWEACEATDERPAGHRKPMPFGGWIYVYKESVGRSKVRWLADVVRNGRSIYRIVHQFQGGAFNLAEEDLAKDQKRYDDDQAYWQKKREERCTS